MIVITTKKQEMSKRALKSRLDRGSINFLQFASKCSDLQRKVSDSKDIRALEALFVH